MHPKIGITELNRKVVAQELSKLLADEHVLYTKTRNAHWNVIGPDFMDKHKFFESQYEQLDSFIDLIAERIRILGFTAPATLAEFLQLSRLKETLFIERESKIFLQALLNDHENIIRDLRQDVVSFAETYHDLGSSDFLTGLMEEHEKMAWFIRAHLS